MLKAIPLSATSPAAAGTAAAAETTGFDQFEWFTIDAALLGATGGTLDVYLQRYANGTWVDWVHFAQLAAGAAAVRYTLDSSAGQTAILAVGSGTTPAIAAGVMTTKHPGDRVRLLFVAGASTSAGALQTVTINGWRSRG